MEIVTGLKADGLLLLPADEPLLTPLVAGLTQQVRTFGIADGDITATVTGESKERTTFEVAGVPFEIPVIGAYNVKNALIAYGIGQAFGLTTAEIRQGLATVTLTKNRTQWLTATNGAQVLSDVYNANPTAMALVL